MPSMLSTPPAVQKMKRRVERRQAEQIKARDAAEATPPAQPASPEPTPEEPAPAAAAPEPQAPAPEPQPESPPAPAPEPAAADPLAAAQAKYDALKEDFTRLQTKSQTSDTKLAAMERRLREMESELLAARRTPPKPVDGRNAAQTHLTEDEKKNLDPGTVDLTARMVAGVVEAHTTPLAEENRRLRRGVLMASLRANVKDFDLINESADFADVWLNERDELTGHIRKGLFLQAVEEANADRVAAFFNRYQRERAPASKTVTPTPLHSVASPNTVRASTPPSPAKAKTFKRSDMKAFYADARRRAGRWSNVAEREEYQRRDREYTLAANEGRIVEG